MYENKQEEQTAVLAAIDTGEYDAQRSMDELEELAKSAGAKVMGRVIQKKDRPDPATLMGSGRVEELAEFVQNSQVELVIFDHELSPAQQKNLENALGAAVIDRTTLILDIFAQRAKTSEDRDREVHKVNVIRDTPLHTFSEGLLQIGVNTLHHQAIKKLGEPLRSMAVADDGIIEAVYHPDKKFVMGVQWHPEILGLSNSISSRIFEAFIDACSKQD